MMLFGLILSLNEGVGQMGLESANYKFTVRNHNPSDFVPILEELGAVPKAPEDGGFLPFELKTDEYFIDFMVYPNEEKSFVTLSLRVALCNPDTVVLKVINILSKLAERFQGTIFDQNAKASFLSIGDKERIQIMDAFVNKKAEFQKWYGNFTAAISGEKVFEYIRNMKK